MAIPRALHQALLQEPGYEAWSAALEAASHMRLDALEALLPEIEPLLDAWPVEELGLTWGLADDVFRENKTVPGFLLVRHVHVAGVYADASKLFDELFATRHPHRIRSIDASGVYGGDWRLGGAGLARLARC